VIRNAFPKSVGAGSELSMRLAVDSDAEMIATWTRAPEVQRFWGGHALALDEVLAKYTGRRAPEVVSYVVCERGQPVGYIQAWQRADRFGLDMFLAAGAQGRGIGPRAAKALATELFGLGWTPLTVDPGIENTRAIRAWREAGFVETGELGEDDDTTTQVMTFAEQV
jgi:aminoglycoside 6'-N-acetyltransferase